MQNERTNERSYLIIEHEMIMKNNKKKRKKHTNLTLEIKMRSMIKMNDVVTDRENVSVE